MAVLYPLDLNSELAPRSTGNGPVWQSTIAWVFLSGTEERKKAQELIMDINNSVALE